jgi:hypothetical protein
MTLLAVKPELPQPDIGSVLDALAKHRPVELSCATSPTNPSTIEVQSRRDLEDRLAERFPFQPQMGPIEDRKRIAVGINLAVGPPISGDGDSLCAAIADFVSNALDYIEQWEHHLRFDAEHQQYWGWVYRLLLAGDDSHIRATLLNQSI